MNTSQETNQFSTSRPTSFWIVAGLAVLPCLSAFVFGSRESGEPPCSVTTGRPALVFSEYLIDYGPDPVAPQPTLTPEFYFRNNGDEKVQITEIQPSCGCLAPAITAKEIDPGAIQKLTLPIRLRNEPSGLREYTVTVAYLDPKPRSVTLTVKAVLPEKSLIVEPRVLMVMGSANSSERHVITISDYRPESAAKPIHVTGVTVSSSLFSAELEGQFPHEGASRTSISVQFRDNPPPGRHRGVINVATDDAMFPMIQIPVIVGDNKRDRSDTVRVSPEPGRIILNSAIPASSSGTTIVFDIPSRWKVTHCDTFPETIIARYESVPGTAPDHQTVSVHLSLTELPERGIEQATLTLNATDGDAPEMVTVPLTLIWK